jgi:ATP-binding cassette, subfamily C, bacteriocin exporter
MVSDGKWTITMKKGTKIKQHDITDCGAACLASVAAHHGLKYPLSRIRQLASTDKRGTNILGLVEAAQKLGFSAKGVKGPYDALFKIPRPAIAHIIVNHTLHHYVVIYGIKKTHISIMDPAYSRIINKKHEDFQKEWTGILVILMPEDHFEKGKKTVSIARRFIHLVEPHKNVMIQAFAGAALYSILGLSTSIFVQKIVDYVLIDGNLNLLHLMGIAMIAILLLRTFINSVKSYLAVQTGQRIDAMLILGYYKHLLKLPQQFFDNMRVGEIISRVNDAIKIRVFVNNVAIELVVDILIIFFTLLLMFIYSWKLTLLVTMVLPILSALYLIFNRLNKNYLRKIMENAADVESHFVESLGSVSTIKRFGAEDHANSKTEFRFVQLLKSTWASARVSIFSSNATELLSGGITLVLLWFGSVEAVNHEITPGILLSFYSLVVYLLSPAASLISSNQAMQDALIAADRLFQIMDLEQEQDEQNKIFLTPEMFSDIYFKNVDFRYGSRKQVFSNLCLTIEKGKITAIVGESGCGKTTLTALLQNMYPVQSGTIEIGQYNIKHISNSSLRKTVGAVPQQIDLFSGTIIENIAMGDHEPDMKLIIEISKSLEISDFIEKLPNGYMTILGEHGTSLSGGEKQRIAFARALYRNPEILILDEATSALDSHSESIVRKTIKSLSNSGKTIIIITHRLSSIIDADRIYLLENGNVTESGNHAQLIEMGEKYYSLFKQQF